MMELSKNVSVDYQVGKIELQNATALKQAVKQVADRYHDLVITEDTIKDDRNTKNELNDLYKKLEEQRKAYKREYKKPLDDFESEIKDIEQPLSDTLDNLKGQLKDFKVNQRKAKCAEIEDFISVMCQERECEPEDIEVQDQWLNVSTTKKQWQASVMEAIKLADTQAIQLKGNIENIKLFAEQMNVEPDAYIYQLQHGSSSVDVVRRMKEDVQHAKEREQARQAIEQVKRVDKETGEIKEPVVNYQLHVSGTCDQLKKLRKFMEDNNIKFKAERK